MELEERRGYLTTILHLRESKVHLRRTEGIRDWYTAIMSNMASLRREGMAMVPSFLPPSPTLAKHTITLEELSKLYMEEEEEQEEQEEGSSGGDSGNSSLQSSSSLQHTITDKQGEGRGRKTTVVEKEEWGRRRATVEEEGRRRMSTMVEVKVRGDQRCKKEDREGRPRSYVSRLQISHV